MNFKDENWINSFCSESISNQKSLMQESGLAYFIKEEDYDLFLTRIRFYPQKLEMILRIINNPDLFGYLYDNTSFIYNYVLCAIFKPFTDYKKAFVTYSPSLPENSIRAPYKNDYWFQLFVNSPYVLGEEELDLRCNYLTESRLSLVLHLSEENVNMFFKLISKEVLLRILRILHDPQLIGDVYNNKSFIYNYIACELNLILARIDGLNQTYLKVPQLDNEKLELISEPEHNELWFEAFINSRIYRNDADAEFDLRMQFFSESKLDLIVREEYLQLFLTGIATNPDDFKTLLRVVHNKRLLEELKTDNSLVRNSVETILKKTLGLNVYEMPFVEFAKKKDYKYIPEDFLALDMDKQFEYFEYTGLNVFFSGFSEKEIKTFLKQMRRHKEDFKQILIFIDLNRLYLEDFNSEVFKQIYEMLLPYLQRIFGTMRFEDNSHTSLKC